MTAKIRTKYIKQLGWSRMRRHVHLVGCTTPVQALRAAHAVNEARIVALMSEGVHEDLRKLEKEFYEEGKRLRRRRANG